jgi:enoyl-CoA hydratase
MNRPEALNAGSEDLTAALVIVCAWLADDVDARAVVLTGAGGAFSAGGDMVRFMRLQTDQALRARAIEEARNMFNHIIDFPLPLVAAVNGPAVGLGCTLAALCDLVYIAESAFISDPHVSVGLTAGDGGAPMWAAHYADRQSQGATFLRLPDIRRRGSRGRSRRRRHAGWRSRRACH